MNCSLIELKFNDPKLEVVSQVLNYALFFNAYKKQLAPLLDNKLSCSSSSLRLKTQWLVMFFMNVLTQFFHTMRMGL